MLNLLNGYVQKMFRKVEKPQTYGSALEAYIVSKNPQNTYDVESLAREFEAKQKTKGWAL
jgi:hypothetical protein